MYPVTLLNARDGTLLARCLPEAVFGPPSAGLSAPWWTVCVCPVQDHSCGQEWEGGPQPNMVGLWLRHSDSPDSPTSSHFLYPSISSHTSTSFLIFLKL